ncbi:hypothetical protein [Desulfovibrio sp. TomC]|uniref:hypothetical protein n=1 Tax=Desulfovibrio sp. TomC TaxID=1562888 RepID=UPI0005746050|nr:hypothetical protein [Desulfovibrio sp. TomC]KHK01138.1 hypothetical protein NY78_3519 [Desulfovibrio sp. TomC]
MPADAQSTSDLNLGFARFSFSKDRSMTAAILLGSDRVPAHGVTDTEVGRISHANTMELMAKFPFEICSKLISIMGKDLVAEAIFKDKENNIDNFYDYCTLQLQKVLFLLNPSAFPVRNSAPAEFLLLISEYIILLNQLCGTFESNPDNYFEIPSQETIIEEIKQIKTQSYDMVFAYEFIRFVCFYYTIFIDLEEHEVDGVNVIKAKDKDVLSDFLGNIFIGRDRASYNIVPASAEDSGYTTVINFINTGSINILAKFSCDSQELIKLKTVQALMILEEKIKAKCSKILYHWNRFIIEPRELQPAGVLRLTAWWESILSDTIFTEQLCKFNALVGRLSVIGIETHSDKFQELGQQTVDIYKEYNTIIEEKLPMRMDTILPKAEEEAALLYNVMIGKIRPEFDSRRYSAQKLSTCSQDRRKRMRDYYNANSEHFVKISLQHIDMLTLEYLKLDRELHKDFLSQVANDYGYSRVSKKSIGRWIANYKKKKRSNH